MPATPPAVPTQVPAAVFAEPEPDRTAVEALAERGVLPGLRFLCTDAARRVCLAGPVGKISSPVGHLDDRRLPRLSSPRLPRVLRRQPCVTPKSRAPRE